MNNTAIIVELKNVRKHPNADKLYLANVVGTTVVVGEDSKDGDIGVYFDSNLKLSPEFLSSNNLYRHETLNSDGKTKGYFEDNGRVKCIKLRGELSDGLFCKLDSLKTTLESNKKKYDESKLVVGYEFNDLSGLKICEKYVIIQHISGTPGQKKGRNTLYSKMFVEHFDTDQYMRNMNNITPGMIYLCEKEHGTSHRTGYVLVDTVETPIRKYLGKLLKLFKIELLSEKWTYLNGTRRVVLTEDKKNTSYHDNTMRDEVLAKLDGCLLKGEELYMEIVGFEKTGAQIQKGFVYGCEQGQYDVLLYRVTMNNVDGKVFDMPREYVYKRADELGLRKPTLFTKYYYDGSPESLEKLTELVVGYAQGQSSICDKTLKEGVVVWYMNNYGHWTALKYKSDAFKLFESKAKDLGVVDPEDIN